MPVLRRRRGSNHRLKKVIIVELIEKVSLVQNVRSIQISLTESVREAFAFQNQLKSARAYHFRADQMTSQQNKIQSSNIVRFLHWHKNQQTQDWLVF